VTYAHTLSFTSSKTPT